MPEAGSAIANRDASIARDDAVSPRGPGGDGDAPDADVDAATDLRPDATVASPVRRNPPRGDCEGVQREGLSYSPGGNRLPDECKPFDPTTNNPYAVRCVDAWPWYATDYPGDEYCILPPPPDQGIQLGFGPLGRDWYEAVRRRDLSGYRAPDPEWIVAPQEERRRDYQTRASNERAFDYYRVDFRMRPGVHRLSASLLDTPLGTGDEGWLPAPDALPHVYPTNLEEHDGLFWTQQRSDESSPMELVQPPEDEGQYRHWPEAPFVAYTVHALNLSEERMLIEGWANLWFQPNAHSEAHWFAGFEPADFVQQRVEPGQIVDLHYAWSIGQDLRLLQALGHHEMWTRNFSAWVERADGEVELVYQNFNAFDMPLLRYDSVYYTNSPDPDWGVPGGYAGDLMLYAGDRLHFNCHVEFTSEHAAILAGPSPADVGYLRFADEAYFGEMCVLFGSTVGGELGVSVHDAGPLPDFTQLAPQPSRSAGAR